jgi:hypothetical protein
VDRERARLARAAARLELIEKSGHAAGAGRGRPCRRPSFRGLRAGHPARS